MEPQEPEDVPNAMSRERVVRTTYLIYGIDEGGDVRAKHEILEKAIAQAAEWAMQNGKKYGVWKLCSVVSVDRAIGLGEKEKTRG